MDPNARPCRDRRSFPSKRRWIPIRYAGLPDPPGTINGRRLIWFDNAATTQKPRCVIERLRHFYEHENSNVHRTAHTLAARATEAYERAREKAAALLHAGSAGEIVFVRGTTEAINLVAQSYGMETLSEGDEVVVSLLEHHANIIPWQLVCQATGAVLRIIPVDESGRILLDEYRKILNKKTKIVSFTHVSNALGTIAPAAEMVRLAHGYGAKVLVDGAQAAAHMKVDVQALDCDFYAFSGHKLYGPTGIGVLYGKASLLEGMRPYQGGGNMISDVTFERTRYKSPPHRFEAGTGSIADAVALGSAIDYVTRIGLDAIYTYERALLRYASSAVRRVPGLALLGDADQKAAILSFVLEGYDCEEVGKRLNEAELPFAPATTARSPFSEDTDWRARCALPSRSTTRPERSTPSSTSSIKSYRMVDICFFRQARPYLTASVLPSSCDWQ